VAFYVFRAKGAISFLAWDIVRGTDRAENAALKARFNWGPSIKRALTLNRAFSAGAFDCTIQPGALPQAARDVTRLWREHGRSPVLTKLFCHGSQLFGAGQTAPLRFAEQLVSSWVD